MPELLGGLGAIGILFWMVLGILWIIIPFVIISINSNLKKNTFQLKEMNRLLTKLTETQIEEL